MIGGNSPTALVTGSSKGLGFGVCQALSENGYSVIGCGRSQAPGWFQENSQKQPSVEYLQADLCSDESTRELIENVQARYSKIDLLVNNVGGAPKFGHFDDMTPNTWLETYNLNVVGPVRVTQGLLPLLKKSASASIINISSTTAVMPGFFNPHYSAAKSALLNFNKHLANILAESRIRVNAINVGPIKTDSWKKNVENLAREKGISVDIADAELTESESAKIPLGELGTVADVSSLILYLSSSGAKWMTGSSIDLDGGKNRGL